MEYMYIVGCFENNNKVRNGMEYMERSVDNVTLLLTSSETQKQQQLISKNRKIKKCFLMKIFNSS